MIKPFNSIRIRLFSLFLILFSSLLLTACGEKPLEAPPPPAYVSQAPENWAKAYQQRKKGKEDFIQSKRVAYEWFANFAFSEVDGIPYILLKLLPELAPEIWGSKENFLDNIGLFMDSRQPNYPIARGIGISGFSRKEPAGNIDYASFTCGACHIGRVRLDNGEFDYLDGAVNAEFNIVLFRVKIVQTLDKVYGFEKNNPDLKYKIFTDKLLEALDRVHKADPNYFYKNFKFAGRHFDTVYEAIQVELFKEKALEYATKFAQRKEAEVNGLKQLVEKNYKGFEDVMLGGLPGMADATGISAVNSYISLSDSIFTSWFASQVLPPAPGLTDFMSVWEQDKRRANWNKSHSQLVNGGGQWNGNVPISVYRNLIASLTLDLKDTDVRVAAFAADLLDGLPASPYPFKVNDKLAKKGQALFTEHCADCHQPRNGKVYTNLGTNMGRAHVVGLILNYGARSVLYENCNPDTVIKMPDASGIEKEVKPCAEYDGVSLKGKKDVLMPSYKLHQGYNARPLSGIWAQAPYLHNGTVPTMYHLLMPETRPNVFVKSQLDYDDKYMGFAWKKQKSPTEGYTFKVNQIPAVSNAGHAHDIVEGNKTYRLDWTGNEAEAMAIIEYLKTL